MRRGNKSIETKKRKENKENKENSEQQKKTLNLGATGIYAFTRGPSSPPSTPPP
jgi:hypothetical protein